MKQLIKKSNHPETKVYGYESGGGASYELYYMEGYNCKYEWVEWECCHLGTGGCAGGPPEKMCQEI